MSEPFSKTGSADRPGNGLTFEKVRISLGGQPLVELDRHVEPGQVLTVMGPSGIGKSTLLAYAAGFLAPAFSPRGRVLVDGTPVTDLPAHARHMGLLFQDPLLFPHMSVGENIAFALPADMRGRATRDAAVRDALASVDLSGFGDRDPGTLSGGQKARVALVRVLASRPQALLLDEPFSRLDAALREQVRTLVFSMARARGLPALLVTHDRDDARAAGGEVIELGTSRLDQA
uniref:ATP-binding cassette domain-containing protein n=1 Tax=Stappia sp. TaxID=1870903 RepID=UPI003BA8C680